ncbi:MAG TPA: hypothetical protein VF520_03075 [Thermoleophilaceae bacterium]|jgi:hypothetical protein
MAVLTMFKIPGDPDELLARKQSELDPVFEPKARENGAIEHLVVKTGDGIMIVNVWETLEGSEKTAQDVGPVAREKGLPQPTDWSSFEVAQRVVVSDAGIGPG